jgi:peptidyl-prolyl cis-trans isomerase B (cyclophilin B)
MRTCFKSLLSSAAIIALALTMSSCRAQNAYESNDLKPSPVFSTQTSTSQGNTMSTPTSATLPLVKFNTNMGSFTLQLDAQKAPKTVENFLQYVRDGHYAGTIFHRVINNFMVQGGGFDANMKQKPTRDPVENEANNGLKNELYTVAMARTSDPHSASAQFFINIKNNDFLNFSAPNNQGWGYAVFGKVIEGTSVVDQMKAVPTGNRGGHGDVPRDAIVVESAEIL